MYLLRIQVRGYHVVVLQTCVVIMEVYTLKKFSATSIHSSLSPFCVMTRDAVFATIPIFRDSGSRRFSLMCCT